MADWEPPLCHPHLIAASQPCVSGAKQEETQVVLCIISLLMGILQNIWTSLLTSERKSHQQNESFLQSSYGEQQREWCAEWRWLCPGLQHRGLKDEDAVSSELQGSDRLLLLQISSA